MSENTKAEISHNENYFHPKHIFSKYGYFLDSYSRLFEIYGKSKN